MDTGQSDFTDPPSPRQICYRILGRDIEDPPCEEGGGGTRRRGGGGASRRRILPDTVSPPLVDCVMREARSIIDGTEWRSL